MPEETRACPACHQPARSVALITVRRLTKVAPTWDAAWFCASPVCEVVYFDVEGEHLDKPDIRVQVFQKRGGVARPVCYCFDHSVADVLAAQREDGSNRIVDEITEACRRGLDRCEETNPQGRCCLGNVRGLLRTSSGPQSCGGCQ